MTVGVMLWAPVQAQVIREVEPGLAPYNNGSGRLTGDVMIGASETLRKLVDLWSEEFRAHHRGVEVRNDLIKDVQAVKAFARGVKPVVEGADIVALSYPLTEQERLDIKAGLGREPIAIPVALDGLVIYVNHKNPLKGLTLDQVAKIFSVPPDQPGGVATWDQLDVGGHLRGREMNFYVRGDESGTYAAFKEMALKGREQVRTPYVQSGSRSVALEVGSDEFGIGYGAMGFATKKVRVLPLAKGEGQPFVPATNQTVAAGDYPLVRQLYVYVVPDANGTVKPTVKEFLAYVLSRDGQRVVLEDGFVPLPARLIEQARYKLDGFSSVAAVSLAAPK
jgi:phosphate transport system substrate-binding protein